MQRGYKPQPLCHAPAEVLYQPQALTHQVEK